MTQLKHPTPTQPRYQLREEIGDQDGNWVDTHIHGEYTELDSALSRWEEGWLIDYWDGVGWHPNIFTPPNGGHCPYCSYSGRAFQSNCNGRCAAIRNHK